MIRNFNQFAIVLAALFLFSDYALSQSLITKLPSDGTAVKYDYNSKTVYGDGRVTKQKGILTIRCVGKEKHKGAEHRVVEIHLDYSVLMNLPTELSMGTRFLIQEKDINNGKGLLENAKSVWSYSSFKTIGKKDKPTLSKRPLLLDRFQPKKEKPESLPQKTIATPIGKLKCKGTKDAFRHTPEFQKAADPNVHTLETYINDQSPFGTVLWKSEVKYPEGFRDETTVQLKAIELNAKPKIDPPD